MGDILERLVSHGWDMHVHVADNIVDVGDALICMLDGDIIGLYKNDVYMRVDGIHISDKSLLCYYKGECVGEVIKI